MTWQGEAKQCLCAFMMWMLRIIAAISRPRPQANIPVCNIYVSYITAAWGHREIHMLPHWAITTSPNYFILHMFSLELCWGHDRKALKGKTQLAHIETICPTTKKNKTFIEILRWEWPDVYHTQIILFKHGLIYKYQLASMKTLWRCVCVLCVSHLKQSLDYRQTSAILRSFLIKLWLYPNVTHSTFIFLY